jgi:hypothetical protein
MGELKQILVSSLKYTTPGSRCLGTQPKSRELRLSTPTIRSSPHGVESVFEGKTLFSSLLDESTHDIKCLGIPWFEPLGVVEH